MHDSVQAAAEVARDGISVEVLDLRSLKQTMQMDILRCKTPELVRKEIWTHVLAYNLIRTIMAQAAAKHDIEPRTISFKGALQTLEAFQPLIDFQGHRGPSFPSGNLAGGDEALEDFDVEADDD